jgi:hypothetical protein
MDNNTAQTNPETPDDLLDTLQITKIERRISANGAWVSGTMGGHRFDALVFPEHAEVPEYELDDSRISKLWVQRISDRQMVVNFDRGWDVQPTTNLAKSIVDLLSAGLAEFVYAGL